MCGDVGRVARVAWRTRLAAGAMVLLSTPTGLAAQGAAPTIGGSGSYPSGEHTFYCALYTEPADAPMLGVGRRPTEGERGRLIDVRISIERLDGERRSTVMNSRDEANRICRANLFQPGIYEITGETTTDSWIWVYNPDASSASVTRLRSQPLGMKLSRSIYQIEIGDIPGAVAPIAPEDDPCQPEVVKPTEPKWGASLPSGIVFDAHLEMAAADTAFMEDVFVEGPARSNGVEMLPPSDVPVVLTWHLPPFQSTQPTLRSLDDYRSKTEYRYDLEKMPAENSAWREAEYTVDLSAQGDCRRTQSWEGTVPFLFARDGEGNPVSVVPNWFYYWTQTSAAQGLRPFIQISYGNVCDDGTTLGYFNGVTAPDRITICKGAQTENTNSVTGQATEGIDTFATTVIHEWKHKTLWDAWFRDIFDECPDCEIYGPEWLERDADRDWVPDRLEGTLGYGLRAGNPDTHVTGLKKADQHYIVYKEEGKWTIGAADEENWAHPGRR